MHIKLDRYNMYKSIEDDKCPKECPKRLLAVLVIEKQHNRDPIVVKATIAGWNIFRPGHTC